MFRLEVHLILQDHSLVVGYLSVRTFSEILVYYFWLYLANTLALQDFGGSKNILLDQARTLIPPESAKGKYF